MTVVARRIASIPKRLASETWIRIVDLVAPTNEAARAEMLAATGIASSLITRESMKASPIVVVGEGPRVRIYCLHGEAAIEGDKANEAELSQSPAESNTWTMSLPCPADDLSWVSPSLAQVSTRITARDAAETSVSEATEESRADIPTVDVEAFLRP